MGVLSSLLSAGNAAKRQLRDLLSSPSGYVEQLGGMLSDNLKEGDARRKRMIENPQSITPQDTQAAMDMAMALAPFGMTVWHGSPHKFDKFDMSKIGTGEGAQAYGHGLYMAEHPEVAKEYQRALGRPDSANLTKAQDIAAWAHSTGVKGNDDAVRILEDEIARLEHYGKFDGKKLKRNDYMEALAMVKQNAAPTNGQLYKVDIPDEAVARFLDWDKPLSQQAHVMEFINKQEAARTQSVLEKRLQTLANVGEDAPNAAIIKKQIAVLQDELANPQGSGLGSMTGGDYYNYLRRRDIPPQEQAEMFSGAGIPGIRYLDQGSRSAGQGSSNFVLFDDNMARILERNGEATGAEPWSPGEWMRLRDLVTP